MRWQEGDWSMEFWDKLYRDSPEKYPYDTEGYSDALGIQWGAIVGEDIAIPIAFRRVFGLKTGYLPFGIQQWGPIGRSASSKKHIIKVLDSISAGSSINPQDADNEFKVCNNMQSSSKQCY